MAQLFGGEADAFRGQLEACRVTDRVHTLVGFCTRIVVDRASVSPLAITDKGAHFEVPGTRYGMALTLWDNDGYLSEIEGVTYGEDLAGQELAKLSFTSFEFYHDVVRR